MDHAQNPRHNEPLEHFNGHARITGPCGDTMNSGFKLKMKKLQVIGFLPQLVRLFFSLWQHDTRNGFTQNSLYRK
jgi:hypothetical protein